MRSPGRATPPSTVRLIVARPRRRIGNLPAEATSFLGRRRELAEVQKALVAARLVSLVGPATIEARNTPNTPSSTGTARPSSKGPGPGTDGEPAILPPAIAAKRMPTR